MDNESATLSELPTSLADELAEFGPYLTMRGAREGEQRLGVAELPLASILIAAWAIKQYLSAFLQEKGRQHAAAKEENGLPDLRKDVALLTSQLDALMSEIRNSHANEQDMSRRWQQLLTRLPPGGRVAAEVELPEAELVALLQDLGLTERAAGRAARKLRSRIRDSLTH